VVEGRPLRWKNNIKKGGILEVEAL
jgi:hypothetical protein